MICLDLDGKVAVVTGASRGLGRAIATSLAEAGCSVAVLGRKLADLDGVRAEIEAEGRRALALEVDVADEAAVERAAEYVVDKFGRVDILVNNAGIAKVAPLLELSVADLRRVFDTNVTGAFLCARAFGAHMVAQHKGTVINIASVSGLVGEPDLSAYSASKAALIGMTRALAIEWARHNITVNAIAPGYFRTDMSKGALDDGKLGPKIVAKIPARRVGQPEELGPLVVFLASDAGAYVTGAVLPIDGGFTAR